MPGSIVSYRIYDGKVSGVWMAAKLSRFQSTVRGYDTLQPGDRVAGPRILVASMIAHRSKQCFCHICPEQQGKRARNS